MTPKVPTLMFELISKLRGAPQAQENCREKQAKSGFVSARSPAPRRARTVRLGSLRYVPLLLATANFACTVTDYHFFDGSVGIGGMPSCSGQACGSGGFAGNPTTPAEAGAPSEPLEDCRIESSGLKAERLQIADSELCLARGKFQLLLGDPSYLIELVECSSDVKQTWTVNEVEAGIIEARNYSVDLNLDVQFAATEVGTPVELFTPHQLYNQRFDVLTVTSDTFKLSPRNAPAQCVSSWNSSLILRPCDDNFTGQAFRRISCR
jgi:hypothetical protein